VNFGESAVDFERRQRGFASTSERLPWDDRGDSDISKLGVAVRESRVRKRVIRIEINRLVEAFDGPVKRFFGSLIPVITTLQIQSIGFCVFSVAPCQPLSLVAGQF